MRYKVTVKTETTSITYDAIGSIDQIFDDAYARFDICAVTVMVTA